MAQVNFDVLFDNGKNGEQGDAPVSTSHPLWLSSETFARVDPLLYFERHVRKGVRPGTMRGFMDFRDVHLQRGSLTGGDYEANQNTNTQQDALAGLDEAEQLALKNLELNTGNNCFGSCVSRSGRSTVVAGVVIGTTETSGAGGIYVNVEFLRGGYNSPPSPEEMVMSQKITDQINAFHFPKSNFEVRVRVPKEALVLEEDEELEDGDLRLETESNAQRKEEENLASQGKMVQQGTELVLTVHVQVLSRTGPSYDLVWTTVLGALQDVELPEFVKDDDEQIYCVERRTGRNLDFGFGNSSMPYSSTFGIAAVDMSKNAELFMKGVSGEDEVDEDDAVEQQVVVLADPDGEIEESCATTQIRVTADKDENFFGFEFGVVGNVEAQGSDLTQGLVVDRQHIEQVLNAAVSRSRDLEVL